MSILPNLPGSSHPAATLELPEVAASAAFLVDSIADDTIADEDIEANAETVSAYLRGLVEQSAVQRPSWQTLPCPSWCLVPHEEGDSPEDREHFGPETPDTPHITLTQHEPYRVGPFIALADGDIRGTQYLPEYATVELRQQVREVEPRVTVLRGGSHALLTMTIAEAREIAAAIAVICDMAEQVQR